MASNVNQIEKPVNKIHILVTTQPSVASLSPVY